MKKDNILMYYVLIFIFGFLYTSVAIFQFDWFYSFGWVIGLFAIGSYVALFPVKGIHRLVGCILQNFAFFLPIKVFMTLNEFNVLHLAAFDNLNPLKILGQLFLIIGVYLCSFLAFYLLLRRRWDQADQLRIVE